MRLGDGTRVNPRQSLSRRRFNRHNRIASYNLQGIIKLQPFPTLLLFLLIGNLPAQIQHNNSPRKKKHMKSSIKQGDDDNNKESLKSPFQNFIANNKSVLTLIQRLNFWNYFLAIFSGSYPRLCVCFCGGCYDQDTWHQPKPKFLNVYGCVSSKRVVGLV
jgi:hypothetical protein